MTLPPSEDADSHRGWIRPAEIWGQIRGREMPRLVSPAIRLRVMRQDDIGEVIVKIIQIFVASFVAILYVVAPRPADVTMLSSPTPYVLAAYLVVTGLGLLWALRPPVPSFVIYLSIVLDFLLLYGLIWSFHIQYHQPPSFVMKSPTLLYVFLFIAIRTLRFEVRFVVAAGMAAAVGWMALLSWVLYAEPNEVVITRNYVTYLTSNSVLIGAEIDKILLIIMVTAVLALSLILAKRLLVSAIIEAQAAVNLARFFEPDVADDIRALDTDIAPGHGNMRDASILFVDLRGFTTIATGRSPSDVLSVLADVQKALVPIIRNHGGTIDKFLGDGIMATFGAVRPLQSHAANALMAAEAVIDGFMEHVNEKEGVWFESDGIGVAVVSGRVISGVVGVEGRMEFTVIGSAVNLCAKLEKHNKDAGTLALTTVQTLRLARRQGFRAHGRYPSRSVVLPGMSDPTEIVVLREKKLGAKLLRFRRRRTGRGTRL